MAFQNSNPGSSKLVGIKPDILLSLATVPVLLGLLAGKTLAGVVVELGQASEELFRGDRLPPLDFPNADPSQTNVKGP